MQPENAIEVKNICKSFKLYYDKGTTLKEKVLFKKRRAFEERRVLDDISFSVRKGEAIGLIGHNGCGKSTTLKLLTRIMYPDSGSIEIQGRVSSLIELGAGFHPDMTGRENIYTNAAIFGLTKKEIDKRVNDIIAFSELGDYIDNPVRTYSSGMYMRLAFSVAINVEADVLLIDEILAVGDANFQIKCFNKLREIKAKGTTIVIVSHSLGQIEQICERTIWIHDGKIKREGAPRDVHPEYLDFVITGHMEGARTQEEAQEIQESVDAICETKDHKEEINDGNQEEVNRTRWGNQNATITKIEMLDKEGRSSNVFRVSEPFSIKINYTVKEKVEDAVFGIAIHRLDGVHCYGVNTWLDGKSNIILDTDRSIEFKVCEMPLLPGQYTLDVAIEKTPGIPIDYYTRCLTFEVCSDEKDVGLVKFRHEWII